jgi:ABC-type nitrate/sulfonate/bicarbonate transport system substrate-binding protein
VRHRPIRSVRSGPARAPGDHRRGGRERVGWRRAVAAGAAAVVIGGSGLCGSAAAAPAGVRTLRIALDYTANVDYLGIYVAEHNGYFAARGIRPDIIPYSGVPAETLLQTGRTDLGLTYPPSIPASRAAGLDYEAVAGLTQRNTIGIAVLASSHYTNVAQLSGTLYGGFGVSSDKPILDDVFRHAGVAHPVVKEVDLGDQAYQALAAHRVAYSLVYGGIDDVTAKLAGVKLRVFPIRRYLPGAFTFPDDAWVATDKEVKDDPGLLRRGLAALSEGYTFAARHPAEAEQILEDDNRTALDHSANIVTATGNATAPTFLTAGGRWGPMDDADFAGITSILVDGGLIKASEAPAPSSDYTNALLP